MRGPETPPAPGWGEGCVSTDKYGTGHCAVEIPGSHVQLSTGEEGQGWVGRGGNDRNSVLISKVALKK